MAIYSGFSHWKWWFSIIMFVYQRLIWSKSFALHKKINRDCLINHTFSRCGAAARCQKKNMWQAKCLHRICLPADRIPNKHRIQSNCMVAVGLPLVAQLWKKSRLSQIWLVGGFHHPGRKYQSVGIFIQGFFTLKPCLKPPGAVDAADHHLHKKLPYKLR